MKKAFKKIILFFALGTMGETPSAHAWWWPFGGKSSEEYSDYHEEEASSYMIDSRGKKRKHGISMTEDGLTLDLKMPRMTRKEVAIENADLRELKIVADKNRKILVHLFGTKRPDMKITSYTGSTFGDKSAPLIQRKGESFVVEAPSAAERMYYKVEVPDTMHVSIKGKDVMLITKDMAKESHTTILSEKGYSVHAMHNENESSFTYKDQGPHVYTMDGSGEVLNISSGHRGVNVMTLKYYNVLREITAGMRRLGDMYRQNNDTPELSYKSPLFVELGFIESDYKKDIRKIEKKNKEKLRALLPQMFSNDAISTSMKFLGKKRSGPFLRYDGLFTFDCLGLSDDLIFFSNILYMTPEMLHGKEDQFLAIEREAEKEVREAFEKYQHKLALLRDKNGMEEKGGKEEKKKTAVHKSVSTEMRNPRRRAETIHRRSGKGKPSRNIYRRQD